MEINALFAAMERIIDDSRAAVLSTVDADGKPHGRWMVPAVLRGNRGALYAVTSPRFHKIEQLAANPRVSWLIQSKSFDEVVEVSGTALVIDNPILKSDVLEALGNRLTTFWHVTPDESELVILETMIERIDYLNPVDGTHKTADAG